MAGILIEEGVTPVMVVSVYKRITIMTMDEFLKLDLGSVVINNSYPGEVYEIYDTDVWGAGYRGQEYRVFGATDRSTHKDIRIDKSNYIYWDVVH